jgi:parallel beta-helix repeat protein
MHDGKTVVLQALLFCLFCVFPHQVVAATYYLDSAHPDTGNGTSASPWQKISQIRNIQPGDALLFKRGRSWHESLVIPASGITVGAYGTGELPLLDASLPVTGQWTQVHAGVYATPWPEQPGVLLYQGTAKPAITTLRFSAVPPELAAGAILLQLDGVYTNLWVTSRTTDTVSGITLFDFRENKKTYVRQLAEGREQQWPATLGYPQLSSSPTGLTRPGHWYWQDGTLYLASAVNPATLQVAVGDKSYGILASGRQDLLIEDIAVRGANEVGVFLLNTGGTTIRNLSIQATGSRGHKTGLLLFNSSNNIIEHNTVASVLKNGIALYAEGGLCRANTLTGNIVTNPGAAGISLSSGGDAATVSGNTIAGNTITGANALSYDAAGIYTLFAGSNTIRSNTIGNCGSEQLRSAGIMADGGTLPLTIAENTIENNSTGGIAVSDSGHQIMDNNLVNNGVSSWDSGQVIFFPVFSPAGNCTVTGNTIIAGEQQFLVYGAIGSTGGHTIDNNAYAGVSSAPFSWSGAQLNFADWKQTTGHDVHSTYRQALQVPRNFRREQAN